MHFGFLSAGEEEEAGFKGELGALRSTDRVTQLQLQVAGCLGSKCSTNGQAGNSGKKRAISGGS